MEEVEVKPEEKKPRQRQQKSSWFKDNQHLLMFWVVMCQFFIISSMVDDSKNLTKFIIHSVNEIYKPIIESSGVEGDYVDYAEYYEELLKNSQENNKILLHENDSLKAEINSIKNRINSIDRRLRVAEDSIISYDQALYDIFD